LSEALTREIEDLRLLMGSPRDPHGRVFAQLGDALRRAGSHREALSVLLDGVSEHPNFSPGHLVLGWAAQESGDLTVARTAFQRTVELDPENPNGLFGLGTLLDLEGDPRGAGLIEEAEALDEQVRILAPRIPEGASRAGAEAGAGDPALEHLPFLSLDEMAPDGTEMTRDETEEAHLEAPRVGEELFGLPFISLDELAPETEAVGAGDGELEDEDLDDPAFAALESLPFVPLEELRPAPEAETSAGDEPADADEDLDLAGPLATRTMGELLVRQGLSAQAVEVFETLVERSPEDAGLRERLAELRAELGNQGEPTSGEEVFPGEPAEPLLDESDGEDAPLDAVDLHSEAAHPSMDPPVPHPEMPSPFHPAAEDAEDEEGEVVGDYFSRLLAWSPGRPEERGGEEGAPGVEEPDTP
jgi:Flp pilus assembly protein TadD